MRQPIVRNTLFQKSNNIFATLNGEEIHKKRLKSSQTATSFFSPLFKRTAHHKHSQRTLSTHQIWGTLSVWDILERT